MPIREGRVADTSDFAQSEIAALNTAVDNVITELRAIAVAAGGGTVIAGVLRVEQPSVLHYVGLALGVLAFAIALVASWRKRQKRDYHNEISALRERLRRRVWARRVSGLLLLGAVVVVSVAWAWPLA